MGDDFFVWYELYMEFIQTRSVPECEAFYKRGITPDTNSELFSIVPNSVYAEYCALKREKTRMEEGKSE